MQHIERESLRVAPLCAGSLLYVFSLTTAGSAMLSEGDDVDSVVSTFALRFLPAGGGGFVLAGVLAAAMSSLDSSTNAVASVISTEWMRLYYRGAPQPDSRLMALGRRVSMMMSAISVVGALGLTRVQKESMNDLYNGLISLTGGASAGLMVLLIFTSSTKVDQGTADSRWYTPSIDGSAALFGLAISLAVSLPAALCSFDVLGPTCTLSYYWILPLSNMSFALGIALFVVARRARFEFPSSPWCMPTTSSRARPQPVVGTNISDGLELLPTCCGSTSRSSNSDGA